MGGDGNTGVGTILKTTDGGATWISQFLPGYTLKSVHFPQANTGYVVGNGGTILKTINGGGVYVEEPKSRVSIYNIYPNPANEKITITGDRNNTGETTITIFNMKGEQAIEGKFQNQKLIEMDASALTKGIYMVKIQATDGIETKKLVIQ